MSRYDKHIFICENDRDPSDPRGCCACLNAKSIKAKFKEKLKALNLSSKVRANSAGCLDACEFGAVVVVYPEQVWYGSVTEEDVDEIVESHILNNKVVERLTIKSQRFQRNFNNNE